MAAIIAAELLGKPALSGSGISISLLAAAAATVAGVLTRSLFATVIAGMVAFSALQLPAALIMLLATVIVAFSLSAFPHALNSNSGIANANIIFAG
ncbi:Uncharacterised protein [Raoultella terrigena]|nr:Uncharacterised protein [Raoultella terrigena]